MRFILIGCGLLTGLFILGMGSCAGVMYFVYKGTDPVAEVGAAFLRSSPELKAAVGGEVAVKRNAFGWNVSTSGDGGSAQISYEVREVTGAPIGQATVSLMRSGGKWTATSARVRRHSGEDLRIGKPPSEHRIKWDD